MSLPSIALARHTLRPSLHRAPRLFSQHRFHSNLSLETRYWDNIPSWKDVSKDEFMSYRWQVCHPLLRLSE